ncbi:MAG: RNA-binding S4 domain-containing protein [Thermotoga sp.]|nr:RNA-binding S4 domain-containing protein [Thermotogota bacterium]RKX55514.1 MAG: RNA-binding S4 domain-containing protein [Thermotoga sp.]
MRVDKFLKVSRIVKRRTVAQKLADNQRVIRNGVYLKPGTQVKVGDALEIHFGEKVMKIEIIEIPNGNVPANKASTLYRVITQG